MRPFERPDEGNYEQPEHPLAGVDRHFRVTAELQAAFPDLPMLGAGYSWLQKFAPNAGAYNLRAGAARFFGMGRNALAYPDFAREALETGAFREAARLQDADLLQLPDAAEEPPAGAVSHGLPAVR